LSMLVYRAVVRFGAAKQVAVFYCFEDACRWLYGFCVGRYYVDGTEYSRETIRDVVLEETL